jgi:hypothetical protein
MPAEDAAAKLKALLEVEGTKVPKISELKLNASERDMVLRACSAQVAINVYRELQKMKVAAELAESGCNIIGNCSCSK